ncbi:MAG: c-type cytochrome, partial [bacterium]
QSSVHGYREFGFLGLMLIMCLSITQCRQDMHDQPRFEPLEANAFFSDGRASRPMVEGTVPRGYLRLDSHLYTGKVDGELVTTFPFLITPDVLNRGRERYDIFCSPCHDKSGSGNGMIVQRGFRPPPSFHIARLRQAPVGHFFDVMTNGLGAMYDYADRVPPRDRWAIAAYIRVLQYSQSASIEDVPAHIQQQLMNQ